MNIDEQRMWELADYDVKQANGLAHEYDWAVVKIMQQDIIAIEHDIDLSRIYGGILECQIENITGGLK